MTRKVQIRNLLRRIRNTLFILFVYMFGTSIPVPIAKVTQQFHQLLNDTPITLISFMSGANLMHLSLFMIGLNPLMIAMLILQLLTMIRIFGIDTLSNNQVMALQQILTAIFTVIQATVLTVTMHLTSGLRDTFIVVLILTAGSLFVVWLGFMNMRFGIGGTVTIVLFNIITLSLPTIIRTFKNLGTLPHSNLWYVLLGILVIFEIVFWTAFSHAYYPVTIINTSLSSKERPVILPIGLNTGAMMTYMIGMSLLMLPTIAGNFLGPKSIFANLYFDATLSGILAFVLFYFFAFMLFNPHDKAKQLRNSNNYVLNVRPGKPTQKYLTKRLIFASLPGALINALQLSMGLVGSKLLGKFAGFAIIPLNAVMVVMFMSGIKDVFLILLFPQKYEKLAKKEV
ncbi:MAG: accessory Sec system protein translocase subunit SecY2 [Lactobacillus sp.]|nr:accessory Sec system protein translocase subunit SecY2 [Lactobacillus sp.]